MKTQIKPQTMTKMFASLAVVLSLGLVAQGATIETETFDIAPTDWEKVSNSGSFPGFSNTNNTAGLSPAGESGGTFPAAWGHYADNTIGSVDFSEDLTITGELGVPNGVNSDPIIQFGYLNTANTLTQAANFLGFRITDQSTSQWRVSTIFNTSADTAIANTNTSSLMIVDPGVYTFEFNYDADGGSGSGQLSLQLFDLSGQVGSTLTQSVSVAQRAEGIDLNGLGWRKVNGNVAEAYVDNLSYTTMEAIPEPGSMTLSAIGMTMLLGYRQRRRTA